MAKTRWLLIAVVVLAALAGGSAWWKAAHSETALEGLQSALEQSTQVWSMKRVIDDVEIADGDRLILYESTLGNVLTARMKRESDFWSEDWKLLGVIGAGSVKRQPGSTSDFAMAATGFQDLWIANGVIYVDQIASLKYEGKDVPIAGRQGDVRVFYLVMPREEYDRSNQQMKWIKGYDKDGNEVGQGSMI